MLSNPGSPFTKGIVLGSALWGWKVSKAEAFSMLDTFFERGGRLLDTASNYPINNSPEDMGLAERWLGEWLLKNPSVNIGIWLKLGSKDNLGGVVPDLSEAYLRDKLNASQELLSGKVEVVGIHWDNRLQDQVEGITETVTFLKQQFALGYKVALSGVKSPKEYYLLWPEMSDKWMIQVKDNALMSDDRKNYAASFPNAHYYAYGINMGGVKSSAAPREGSSLALRGLTPHQIAEKIEDCLSSTEGMSPTPKTFNDIALMRVFLIEQIKGVILGPSNQTQLKESLDFCQALSYGISVQTKERMGQFLSLL